MATFFRAQIALAIISLLIPGICWALVLLDIADPFIASNFATPGLVICWLIMMILPYVYSQGASKRAIYTSTIIFWGVITTIFPIIWDLTWALMHNVLYGATAEDKWLWFWWAYAVADTRFLQSFDVVIIVEYWSGILGIAEGYALYLFLKNDVKKAFRVAMTAGLLQFYGCTVFFGTEAMVNFENIRPDFISFYIKFLGLNGFWLVMPFLSGYCYMKVMKMPDYNVQDVLKNEILDQSGASRHG